MNNYSQWFAVRKSDFGVIAAGDSHLECFESAAVASGFDGELGVDAPYFMTNAPWFGSSLPDCDY